MEHISLSVFGGHLLTAGLLGAIIGTERQWHQGMAGLRTNSLVATAAAAFVSLPAVLGEDGTGPAHSATFVMTGLGFLCGGLIFRDGSNIKGLNTAATVWATGAVGAFAGSGLHMYAVLITAAILFANFIMRPAVVLLNRAMDAWGAGNPTAYTVEGTCEESTVEEIRKALSTGLDRRKVGFHGLSLISGDAANPQRASFKAELMSYGGDSEEPENMVSRLWKIQGISSVKWQLSVPEKDPKSASGS